MLSLAVAAPRTSWSGSTRIRGEWAGETPKIQIKGEDSFGVLMRILDIICNEYKANLRDLHVTSEDNYFQCNIELVVFKQKVVSQISMKLRSIERITSVTVLEIV